ncbi:TlpA disulfide reductase family protein [Sphingomonas limnosediminicola]|uniref:TlpA disulfide reductase family protein n=1 Tax=Sphingomonas limnosediminicola TaxID=940133 RepID=A0ABP7LE21_9SPHN
MRTLLICSVLFAVSACHKPAEQSPAENVAASEQPAGPVKGVDRSHRGQAAPDATFKSADGEDASLAELMGKTVLVNLWATWCAPCVKELPTLDRLAAAQQKAGGVQVIAVSQDSGPHASVEAFLEAHKIQTLGAYQDEKMALSGALGPDTVLPTTILLDAQGKEVWRYVGDLDWTSAEAAKLLSEAGASGKL